MYFLGIDGGGTKTKGVISDEKGIVIAEATVGPSNPNNVGFDCMEVEFKKLFSTLGKEIKINISCVDYAFAGMSGVSRLSDKNRIQRILSGLLDGSDKISVDNDAVVALYSGTLGESGIVQISGTGSITYGINDQGVHNRVGGWGHLINEAGSGFSIGQDALTAAFQSHDGLAGETVLGHFLIEYFHVKTLPEVIQHVYHANNVKLEIAALAKLVFNAADQNDEIAKSIIYHHGRIMGQRITCLIEKLFEVESYTRIPVVPVGGIFNRMDLFKYVIEREIASKKKNAVLITPEVEPVAGAVVAALNAIHMKVEKNSFIDNYNYKVKGLKQ